MLKMVVFSKDMKSNILDEYSNVLHYPESKMGIEEQLSFECPDDIEYIITTSPFIVAAYDRSIVHEIIDNNLHRVSFQTYGCAPDIIIKYLTSLRTTQPRKVVEEVRKYIEKGKGYDFVDKRLGDSGEKAYLLRKLRDWLKVNNLIDKILK